MANHIKFCSCRMCRAGRHTKYGSYIVQAAIRKNRRKTKADLKQGKETNQIVSVPYTDQENEMKRSAYTLVELMFCVIFVLTLAALGV